MSNISIGTTIIPVVTTDNSILYFISIYSLYSLFTLMFLILLLSVTSIRLCYNYLWTSSWLLHLIGVYNFDVLGVTSFLPVISVTSSKFDLTGVYSFDDYLLKTWRIFGFYWYLQFLSSFYTTFRQSRDVTIIC